MLQREIRTMFYRQSLSCMRMFIKTHQQLQREQELQQQLYLYLFGNLVDMFRSHERAVNHVL